MANNERVGELFAGLPERVSIYEVGPRDGLQNEAASVGTSNKLRLVEALVDAGLRRIEVTSFVAPRWIPQLSDADVLGPMLPKMKDVRFSALCPNRKGLERARAAGFDEIALFASASESHNQRNLNRSVDAMLALYASFVPDALDAGMRVRAYVSTSWGCPYEGEVEPRKVLALAQRFADLGCYEISLGDTIGVGTPLQTKRLLELISTEIPIDRLALHLHDTRGQALPNVLVGLEMGVRTFDSAIGGLGGCPYAPGASGNLATEDLAYMLERMGIATGLDQEKLQHAGSVAAALVDRKLPGRVHQAGLRARGVRLSDP